ncbi:MAG: hypothetical protein P8J32_01040 [bacterium]|nr:hypothetical protein [bacterium]
MQQNVPKSWIFIFLAVIAAITGLILTTEPTEEVVEEPTEEVMEATRSTTFTNMLATGEDAIYLENQPADTQSVDVGYVVLSQPGYVVIAADNDGVPGERIGTSRWMDDGGEHVTVDLTQTLLHDNVYYAVVHHDNGDGTFNVSTDPAATDTLDSVVLMTFIALDGAAPENKPVMP